MTTIGQSILDREAASLIRVLPRPGNVPPQPPGVHVSRRAIRPCVGPYRGGAASEEVTIAGKPPTPWWLILLVALAICVGAHALASSIGFDWPATATIAFMGLSLLFDRIRRGARRRIDIDHDALHVSADKQHASIARPRLAAIESCEERTRVDVKLAGMTVRKGADWITTYYVRARLDDGTTRQLMSLATVEDCWWLQATVEQVLGSGAPR